MELLITLAISAILLTVAVPSFRTIIAANRLATTTNGFVNALYGARAQAIRSGQSTVFCGTSSAPGTPCGTSAPGSVYAMQNGTYQATPFVAAPPLPAGLQIGAQGIPVLRYGGDGIARAVTADTDAPYSGLVADIQAQDAGSSGHRCLYLVTGSSLNSCSSSSACSTDAPANCQ